MNTNKQRVLIVTLLFLIVGGCAGYTVIDLPVRADSQEEHMYWESVTRGGLLYANNCRTCHGNQGEGFVAPALNRSDWRDQDPIALEENQEMLWQTLACGRAGTTMPAWLDEHGGALNVRQIEHLVNLLTAPENGDEYVDQDGEPTSRGWVDARRFAHNLNMELVPSITGDSLQSIADAHNLGVERLAEANDVPMDEVDQTLERGRTIQVPPNNQDPEGTEYTIIGDFDSIETLTGDLYVGATMIADLNDIDYEVDYVGSEFRLLDEDGQPVSGLLPGEELALPEEATYTVIAGDSLESIAEQRNISPNEIRALNEAMLEGIEDDEEMDGERHLELPADPVVILADDLDWDVVAEWYGLEGDELATLNDAGEEDEAPANEPIQLPDGAEYTVQELDTLEGIAQMHDTTVEELMELNPEIDDPDDVTHEIVLDLPQVDAYVIQGDDFSDVADEYGNVNGAELAQANGYTEDDVLRVGTQLELPDHAYGTAPADAVNTGEGCVQHAVTEGTYASIVGDPDAVEDDFPPAEPPEDFTDELVIRSHNTDWTFDADGEELEPNRGVAKIRPGTTVLWENVGPTLHTVTIGGETEDPNFAEGDTFEFTFNETGEYQITCDFHPEQDGYVYVEEDDGSGDAGEEEAAE